MIKRPLTDGEIKLAKKIFGESIDYTRVNIQGIKNNPLISNMGISPDGNIYMVGCYVDDYSEQNSGRRAHFIHEMTHVWQFQNKIFNPIPEAAKLSLKYKFNYAAAYFYKLEKDKDLSQHNMEQQAVIIEEYFLLKHEGRAYSAGRCQNECGIDERKELFEKTLSKFLKNPRYAKRDKFPSFFGKGPSKN